MVLLWEIFIDYHSNDVPVKILKVQPPFQPSDIKNSLYWQT